MGLSILKILGLLNFAVFLVMMLVNKGDKNQLFIKFILLSYPVLAIYLIPILTGFDMICFTFLFVFYKKREQSFREGFVYTVIFVVMLLLVAIGMFLADEGIGIESITDYLSIFPVFIFSKILIDECLEDMDFFYEIIRCLKITLIVSFVFLCLQFVLGVQFSLSAHQNPNIIISDGIRYPSFLSDPQVYSQYLAAMSFICLIKDKEGNNLKVINYVLAILCLLAIFTAGGRAGMLGWAVGMSLMVLFSNANYRITVLVTCGILYLVALNFGDSFAIFKRGGDMSETYDFRHGIWEDAYQIFLGQPFFGIGIGNYAKYVTVHNPDQFWLVENEFIYFDHPESGYLKFLTELGATGFVCIFLFVLLPMFNAFLVYLRTKDSSIILLISAVLSWMTGFYSTYSFGDVRLKVLIITILCLLILSKQRLLQNNTETEEAEPVPQ
jgi:O-antigen ligase